MLCPRCYNDSGVLVNDTHYICQREECTDENNIRTEFLHVVDSELHFPYNIIFQNRELKEFYRNSYLDVKHL